MEDNISKDLRNLFRLKREIKKKKKEIDYTPIKYIRNPFRSKKKKISNRRYDN